MKLLKDYLDLQQQIYDYFGYVEDWVVIPIEDNTESYWWLYNETVWFSSAPFTVETVLEGDDLYSYNVYHQRFLPKWVYRAADYTMICSDTKVDGNKFLAIFDNGKELLNPSVELREAFGEWGDIL